MNPLLQLLISQTPNIVAFVMEKWKEAHPTEPPPTEDEVVAAALTAFQSSLAKDDQWLAVHGGGGPV